MVLFYYDGRWWWIVTGYFSRYQEITKLQSLNAQDVVTRCKLIFARYGKPYIVVSDNCFQFSRVASAAFSKTANKYGFQHITSTFSYPQSNGSAKTAVKVYKTSMSKTGDPYKALLSYERHL